MSRILTELPERFVFSTEIPLLGLHINFGGHLDNALLLSLVSEARVRYFLSLGYTALDVDGVGVIVADAAVQYKSEAFYGETMVLELATRDFHKYGFDVVWRISDKATGREVARGKTGVMCIDYKIRKVAPIPEKFLHKLQNS